MRLRKTSVAGIAAAVAALSACVPVSDKNYHGSVTGSQAPGGTVSTPAVPAYPVTISGTGESVKTADLVTHGYTVTYQASSDYLIVAPVQADGSDGAAIINAGGGSSGGGVTGTTTYRATGRTTLHVYNTQGPWSLTFNPL